ncbi:MAG TPA: hypothetical protein VGD71_24725 [Kribbella sp.]
MTVPSTQAASRRMLIERACVDLPRLLLFSNPSNPTGAVSRGSSKFRRVPYLRGDPVQATAYLFPDIS